MVFFYFLLHSSLTQEIFSILAGFNTIYRVLWRLGYLFFSHPVYWHRSVASAA